MCIRRLRSFLFALPLVLLAVLFPHPVFCEGLVTHTTAWDYLVPVGGRHLEPISPRLTMLGSTGLALSTGTDALWMNPSLLRDDEDVKKYTIRALEVDAQVHGLSRILKNELSREALNGLLGGKKNTPESIAKLIAPYFDHMRNGKIADVTLHALSGSFYGAGLDLFANAQVVTRNEKGKVDNFIAVAKLSLGGAVGYAMPVWALPEKDMKLKVGLSLAVYAEVFTDAFTVDMVWKTFSGFSFTDFLETPIMLGVAHPVNIGASFEWGKHTFGLAWRNLFNIYPIHYNTFALNTWTLKTESIKTGGIWGSLDFGWGWNPKWKFNPRFEVDFIGLNRLTGAKSFTDFMARHIRAGAEYNVADIFQVRLGLNKGYMTFGAELDLWGVSLCASYGWTSFSDLDGGQIGDTRSDYFSVNVHFGWNRTR